MLKKAIDRVRKLAIRMQNKGVVSKAGLNKNRMAAFKKINADRIA